MPLWGVVNVTRVIKRVRGYEFGVNNLMPVNGYWMLRNRN
jgi:hypothetical protein